MRPDQNGRNGADAKKISLEFILKGPTVSEAILA